MKTAFFKSNIRKIKESYKRFLSILMLSLLGVGFYAGIKTTEPNMMKTLDNYYDKSNLYDIEIFSTLGFNDKNIKNIKEIKEVKNAYGAFSKDKEVTIKQKEMVIKFIEINKNINKIEILDGNIPKNKNEIVIEEEFFVNNKIKLNDYITVDDKEVKIVGIVKSPYYITREKGITQVGSGVVNYFAYTTEDYFDEDYYTNIFIEVDSAKEKITNRYGYNKLVDNCVSKIEDIQKDEEELRYNEVYKELLDNIKTFNLDIKDFDIVDQEWFIQTRKDNQGYKDFTSAALNIKNLGNVFPIIFYAVAVLISLITMMRMIEEDRGQIGTLKSLGFDNRQIRRRYLSYAVIPTFIGGIIGSIIGISLIPKVVWNIYNNMMFFVPGYTNEFNFYYSSLGTLISVICVFVVTYYVTNKNLKEKPAQLMREKTPKSGKRILLEKITPIWKLFNFSNKIMLRNLFRYKSRMLVSIIGIGGSTALVLIGFGIKDSIRDIAKYQYEEVFVYDQIVNFKSNLEMPEVDKVLNNHKEITNKKYALMESIEIENKKYEINLMIPNTNFKNSINLIDSETDKKLQLRDNEIFLSLKLSKRNEIEVGDKIEVNGQKLKVGAIVNNYIQDYGYMTKKTYKKVFNKEFKPNIVLVSTSKNINKKLLKEDAITNIVTSKTTYDLVKETISSLDSVVVILIIAAALLSLVIMYNLSNINISERKREIATLKVLGFYDKEVDSYINRESNILTSFGIFFGLLFGKYLTFYIISTCEPSMLMFGRSVYFTSYLFTALIIITFMVLVEFLIHIYLRKIDMIESLKNRE